MPFHEDMVTLARGRRPALVWLREGAQAAARACAADDSRVARAAFGAAAHVVGLLEEEVAADCAVALCSGARRASRRDDGAAARDACVALEAIISSPTSVGRAALLRLARAPRALFALAGLLVRVRVPFYDSSRPTRRSRADGDNVASMAWNRHAMAQTQLRKHVASALGAQTTSVKPRRPSNHHQHRSATYWQQRSTGGEVSHNEATRPSRAFVGRASPGYWRRAPRAPRLWRSR